MNSNASQSGISLYFSRWNRKGYAVFASLGREVRIGALSLHMCEVALRKSSRNGVIVNLPEIFERMVALFEEYGEDIVKAEGILLPVMVDTGCIRIYKL